MKLIDFQASEQFLELREAMSAYKDGHFELFDPTKHSTSWQREQMYSIGLEVLANTLTEERNKVLKFLDCRVLVYEEKSQLLHFTRCPLVHCLSEIPVKIFTKLDSRLYKNILICDECWSIWHSNRMNRRRARHPFGLPLKEDIESVLSCLFLGKVTQSIFSLEK